jgi:hypothetical protein
LVASECPADRDKPSQTKPRSRNVPSRTHITATGLGEGQHFRAAFPTVQIKPSRPLPFEYGEFDIACANAVLEHVGSRELQRSFIRELARVGRRVFLTVPHRYFPVEHHTAIPLLHFTDPTFRLATPAGRTTSRRRRALPRTIR